MTTSEIPSRPKRRLRYALITLAAFALTVALFYGEEDWRGWLAFTRCRDDLQARGIKLDWSSYIPAPVPEDQNFFGVPQMQEGFVRHYEKNRLAKWPTNWPATWTTNAGRMVIAHLTMGPAGMTPPPGSVEVPWDGKGWPDINGLIRDAIGPAAQNPGGGIYPKQSPSDIRPAQIFLRCPSPPQDKDFTNSKPGIFNSWDSSEDVKVERAGAGSYEVTMNTPMTAAEFLKSNEQIEPDLDLIRGALRRPYARLQGDYSEPAHIPVPNFVFQRNFAQRLNAIARCHLLLGEPDQALDDLILVDDTCRRTLEDNRPMTLVSAMINVAVRGLDAETMDEGLQSNVWREPQLAALEKQLQAVNVLSPVKQAMGGERESTWYYLSTKAPAPLLKLFKDFGSDPAGNWFHSLAWSLVPRGWVYQNAVTASRLHDAMGTDAIDTNAQTVSPSSVDAGRKQMDAAFSHWSPYSFLDALFIPNFTRAWTTTAQNQTMIHQASIVCGLQRYHLAHGEYPETLDALVPQYLDAVPHDVIGGQPPHYRRNADGTFLLYSIGWDEQDHGGKGAGDWFKGDYVWPCQRD